MFEGACTQLETVLARDERRRVLGDLTEGLTPSRGLARVRDALRTNLRDAGGPYTALDGLVTRLDARTRRDGFHVLHDWDGAADRVNPETIAVDVASFGQRIAAATNPAMPPPRRFCSTITTPTCSACSRCARGTRGTPTRISIASILAAGAAAGGRRQRAPVRLAGRHAASDRDRALRAERERLQRAPREGASGRSISVTRIEVAVDHAVAMGCHLRFGFEASGWARRRRRRVMRADNAADYPWLHFSIETLLDA